MSALAETTPPADLPTGLNVAAFLAWAPRQAGRYELVEGTPKMQPYVKLNHNRIVANLTLAIGPQLDPRRFELAAGDFAVEVGPRTLRYADLMVLPAGKDGHIRSVPDAKLLVEVLSESTMHVDFGEKRHEYMSLPDLEIYVVLAQDEPRAWIWQRDEKRLWPHDPLIIEGADAVLSLPYLGASVRLADVYRNVA
ncbi:Uma2 family endonuclease [Aurantimonas sp. HBX-1]|uniref:Uma2 family endonuclease n=1 Tax=Aurantimonas sp. HBX-1 TaxID=2906072 RepID=UPI001F477A88|nr:Uma2 family endonuclease [Aurantimonas sp. HBX-1]UIJ73654.1 Uma2 family endonuclease [Aurantimonas sp. HBX-1]